MLALSRSPANLLPFPKEKIFQDSHGETHFTAFQGVLIGSDGMPFGTPAFERQNAYVIEETRSQSHLANFVVEPLTPQRDAPKEFVEPLPASHYENPVWLLFGPQRASPRELPGSSLDMPSGNPPLVRQNADILPPRKRGRSE